jgi:hypothetical protein
MLRRGSGRIRSQGRGRKQHSVAEPARKLRYAVQTLAVARKTRSGAKEMGVAVARLWTRTDYASLAKRGGKGVR